MRQTSNAFQSIDNFCVLWYNEMKMVYYALRVGNTPKKWVVNGLLIYRKEAFYI